MHDAAAHADVQLVTVRQAAALLAVSTRSVWRMVADGTLPQPIRLGSRVVRFRLADLQRTIEGGGGK